jgi:hypothetical protein
LYLIVLFLNLQKASAIYQKIGERPTFNLAFFSSSAKNATENDRVAKKLPVFYFSAPFPPCSLRRPAGRNELSGTTKSDFVRPKSDLVLSISVLVCRRKTARRKGPYVSGKKAYVHRNELLTLQ